MSHSTLEEVQDASIDAATRIEETADRLYRAEVALHAARTSHVDAWINAAYESLHVAVAAHSAAMARVTS